MIDPKSLRIGNKVSLANESNNPIVTIETIGYNRVAVKEKTRYYEFEDLLPIQLRSSILTKMCGFNDRSGIIKNGMSFGIDLDESRELAWYIQDGFIRYQTKLNGFTTQLGHIDSLHLLQNFYYFLMGKELIINNL